MTSIISLGSGVLALLLPLFALFRKKDARTAAAVSMGLCAVALLGQITEYNIRVGAEDFSSLLDMSSAMRFCSVALLVLSAVLNLAVCLYQSRKNAG